jgi:hypothetical protein
MLHERPCTGSGELSGCGYGKDELHFNCCRLKLFGCELIRYDGPVQTQCKYKGGRALHRAIPLVFSVARSKVCSIYLWQFCSGPSFGCDAEPHIT